MSFSVAYFVAAVRKVLLSIRSVLMRAMSISLTISFSLRSKRSISFRIVPFSAIKALPV